jgi:hypothetical protein
LWCWYRRLRPHLPLPITIVVIIISTIITLTVPRRPALVKNHKSETIAVSLFAFGPALTGFLVDRTGHLGAALVNCRVRGWRICLHPGGGARRLFADRTCR